MTLVLQKKLSPILIDDVLTHNMSYLPRGYGNLMFKYQPYERRLIVFHDDPEIGVTYVLNHKVIIHDMTLSQMEQNKNASENSKKLMFDKLCAPNVQDEEEDYSSNYSD